MTHAAEQVTDVFAGANPLRLLPIPAAGPAASAGAVFVASLLTRFLGTGALRYVLQPGQRLVMEGKDA